MNKMTQLETLIKGVDALHNQFDDTNGFLQEILEVMKEQKSILAREKFDEDVEIEMEYAAQVEYLARKLAAATPKSSLPCPQGTNVSTCRKSLSECWKCWVKKSENAAELMTKSIANKAIA